MAKAFSVASWNVEHFGAPTSSKNKTPKKPIAPIIDFLAQQKADVVAVYEVRSRVVFRPLVAAMPNYQFHITEGPQMQEILVGVKHGVSAYVTQKLTFQSGQSTLRPGVLVSVLVDGAFYPMVFLHLKSAPDPKGFGLRDDMMRRALDFRKTLNKVEGAAGSANYLFIGDLNTMGLDYIGKQHDISGPQEIGELERRTQFRQMRVLSKSAPHTWSNGSQSSTPPSDLDHVVAADHLTFKKFGGAEVDVRGWPELGTDAERDDWIEKFSDHGLLFFVVQKV